MSLTQYFSYTPTKTIPRIAASLDGLDKRGKSHYAIMTTPEPVLVVSVDTGTESIVTKARKAGRKVGLMNLEFTPADPSVKKKEDIDKKQHADWKAEWSRFESAMSLLASEPVGPTRTRTVVWDTGTDIKNLLELAYFGKSKGNIQQDLRTEMNGAFHNVFWSLYKNRPDLNILICHKNKKQYVNKEWNGKYERDGHSQIGFFVDLTLNFDWDPLAKDFYTEIAATQPFRYMDLSSAESLIMGKRWYASVDPANPSAFWHLGSQVFPETDIGEWM